MTQLGYVGQFEPIATSKPDRYNLQRKLADLTRPLLVARLFCAFGSTVPLRDSLAIKVTKWLDAAIVPYNANMYTAGNKNIKRTWTLDFTMVRFFFKKIICEPGKLPNTRLNMTTHSEKVPLSASSICIIKYHDLTIKPETPHWKHLHPKKDHETSINPRTQGKNPQNCHKSTMNTKHHKSLGEVNTKPFLWVLLSPQHPAFSSVLKCHTCSCPPRGLPNASCFVLFCSLRLLWLLISFFKVFLACFRGLLAFFLVKMCKKLATSSRLQKRGFFWGFLSLLRSHKTCPWKMCRKLALKNFLMLRGFHSRITSPFASNFVAIHWVHFLQNDQKPPGIAFQFLPFQDFFGLDSFEKFGAGYKEVFGGKLPLSPWG